MSGSGYDYTCGTFSPDGRIFQVEYAQKAVESSGTAIGIRCTDGIVVAVGKPQASRLLVPGSNRRVFSIDSQAGGVVTGYAADGRQLANRAREEAQSYRDTYGHHVLPRILANRLSLYVHYFTIHGSLRPFGSAAIIAGYDQDLKTPELYMIDPSGNGYRYFGCAAGKGANAAKTELEKLLNKQGNTGITTTEAVKELARILHVIRDPTKDKPLEIELGWLTEGTKWNFVHVPKDLVQEADKYGLSVVGTEGNIVDTSASEAVEGSTETAGVQMETEDTPMEVGDL